MMIHGGESAKGKAELKLWLMKVERENVKLEGEV